MKIQVWFETTQVGSKVSDEIEVPDDASEEDVQAHADQWMQEQYSGGWYRKE